MGRLLRTSALAFAAALAVWFVAPRTRGEVRLTAPPPPNGEPLRPGTAIGTTGCLAVACHGGPAADALAGKSVGPMWPASGTCWVARDPHAAAFDALVREKTRLGGPPARDIVAKLGGQVPATEDVRCLACHTNPSLANPTTDPRVIELCRDGVGCEACHGNAGGWVRSHTAGDFTGMTPLREVGDRAAACVGCHVGAAVDPDRKYPLRDMNHDMIAAGHPRLDFDYAEYSRRLPKHWRERETRSPVREWFVGRVAHAEAACHLLADRAERAAKDDPRTPWPEFAEFDCASCHHPFGPEPKATGTRPPGVPAWQAMWPVTADAVAKEMEVKRTPTPNRVVPVARDAARELGEFRRVLADTPEPKFREHAARLMFLASVEDAGRDELIQMLRGLAAHERARPPADRRSTADFERTFDVLRRGSLSGARTAVDRLWRRELP